MVLIVFIESFFLVVHSSSSVEIEATTVFSKVIDGDTFDTTSAGRIRLADVEKGEIGYYEAKDFLTSLVYNKHVYLDIDDVYETDRYGRLVCVVYVDYNTTHLKNVNKALLVEGYAVIWNLNNEFNPYTWTLYHPKERSPEPFLPTSELYMIAIVIIAGLVLIVAIAGFVLYRKEERTSSKMK